MVTVLKRTHTQWHPGTRGNNRKTNRHTTGNTHASTHTAVQQTKADQFTHDAFFRTLFPRATDHFLRGNKKCSNSHLPHQFTHRTAYNCPGSPPQPPFDRSQDRLFSHIRVENCRSPLKLTHPLSLDGRILPYAQPVRRRKANGSGFGNNLS